MLRGSPGDPAGFGSPSFEQSGSQKRLFPERKRRFLKVRKPLGEGGY